MRRVRGWLVFKRLNGVIRLLKECICNALLKIKINERLQASKPIIFWNTAENALYEGRQGILLDLKEFTLYYEIALVWQADERVLNLKSENLGSDFRFRHVLAVT